jgi:hypothetical protein
MGRGGLSVHGFRSSFTDWCAERIPMVEPGLAEMAIAHRVPPVKGAYQRTVLLQKRRQLAEEWADYCDGKRGQVIAIGAR